MQSDLHLTKKEHYRVQLYKEVSMLQSSDSNRDLLVVSYERFYICSCPTRKQVLRYSYCALLVAGSRILAHSH